MKRNPISLRRRQLMMAGLVGVAAPAAVFATPGAGAPASASEGAEQLVISGRILDADRKPLAGATIEAWGPEDIGDRATVITDADGRFFAALAPAGHSRGLRQLSYRISHPTLGALPARNLHLKRAPGVAGERVAHLQRDEMGVWRASFGVTLV